MNKIASNFILDIWTKKPSSNGKGNVKGYLWYLWYFILTMTVFSSVLCSTDTSCLPAFVRIEEALRLMQ